MTADRSLQCRVRAANLLARGRHQRNGIRLDHELPAGIDCGSDCGQDYDYGTAVSLTATPEAGSSFVGWNGDPDCSDGSVTMDQAHSCTASFDLLPPTLYSLTIFKTGTGNGTVSSSPTGIDCGSDCTEEFEEDTLVTLTTAPSTRSTFAGWSGDPECSDGTVSMIAARTCTATFNLETHPLTIAQAGSGSGTVTSSPTGIDCGADCNQTTTTARPCP